MSKLSLHQVSPLSRTIKKGISFSCFPQMHNTETVGLASWWCRRVRLPQFSCENTAGTCPLPVLLLSIAETVARELLLNSITPLTWTTVIWISLAVGRKFLENSTQITCLEITGYRIKESTVFWLLYLQIRRGRKL